MEKMHFSVSLRIPKPMFMRQIIVVFFLVLWTVPRVSVAATEEPTFTIVESYDQWELRQYAPTLEAQVEVRGVFRSAVSQGFRLLADFIFGNNVSPTGNGAQKIAMTAPVSAAPRLQAGITNDNGARWVVTFTMPSVFTVASLPKPVNSRVIIHQNKGGLYAAIRFKGKIKNPDSWAGVEGTLRQAIQEQRLSAAGTVRTAQYDGPWVPGPFRRNELLLPVRCLAADDPRCSGKAP